ncbi:replication protein [Robbsia andropogonis]|uniref:replication protein n=1 Tax=Robbsia andropogonis TaxID=28092 RepID=UPI003D1D2990
MDASPQVQDGYTRIANELLEAMLSAGLTSRQWTVLMAVIRKTYGFNKKADDIALRQLSEMTGIAKAHVSVTLRELVERNIVVRVPGKFAHELSINKRYVEWKGVTKSVTQKIKEVPAVEAVASVPEVTESVTPETPGGGSQISNPAVTESVTPETPGGGSQISNPAVTESVTPEVTESVTTKDNFPKDNYQKTETLKPFPRSLRERFEIFWLAYPKKVEKKEALEVFTKLNPDDGLLTDILSGLETAKRTEQWKVKRFIKHASVWLKRACWQDEHQVEYSADQVAVINAFNENLGDTLGRIDAALYLEGRAGQIDDFLGRRPSDPTFWKRYFAWVAGNVEVPARCGFDWLIGRDGFSKVVAGQFTRAHA